MPIPSRLVDGFVESSLWGAGKSQCTIELLECLIVDRCISRRSGEAPLGCRMHLHVARYRRPGGMLPDLWWLAEESLKSRKLYRHKIESFASRQIKERHQAGIAAASDRPKMSDLGIIDNNQ